MAIRYNINPETGHPHILDHGVTEEEVADVFESSPEDRRGRNGTRIAIGRTSGGRILRVVYVQERGGDAPNDKFIITAYDLRANDAAAYRRRMRR